MVQVSTEVLTRLANLKKPFPLRALLTIYLNASKKDLYIDYFAGFKLLVRWLGPIEIPTLVVPSYPAVCISYEVDRIATILGVHPNLIFHTFMEIHNDHRLTN